MVREMYDANVYDRTLPIGSYWDETIARTDIDRPLKGDVTCDIAVIGGGITGLTAALHLAKDSAVSVSLVELEVWVGARRGAMAGFVV